MDKFERAEITLQISGLMMELVSRARGRINFVTSTEEAFHILFEEASKLLDEANEDYDAVMRDKTKSDEANNRLNPEF